MKHIIPRTLPEPSAAPAAPQPSAPVPPTSSTVHATAPPHPTVSPMQYSMTPGGASVAKIDMRNNSGVDRRKRKYALFYFVGDYAATEAFDVWKNISFHSVFDFGRKEG